MAGKLDDLKTQLKAGARGNKYKVFLGSKVSDGDVLCKAASFPGVTVGQIEVYNQGRKLVIPGDTTYSNTWALTFYGTEDHKIRNEFITWMKQCDDFQNNKHAANPADVMLTMKVTQLKSDGTDGPTYEFHNVFPQDIGEITLGDDANDAILEFDVTLSFTDWIKV